MPQPTMEQMMTAEWLIGAIATGILGLIWWDIRQFKKWVINEVKEVKSTQKKALYHQGGPEHGTTIYVPRTECSRERVNCQTGLADSLNGIRVDLNRIEEKREQTREMLIKGLGDVQTKVAELHGQVAQMQRERKT